MIYQENMCVDEDEDEATDCCLFGILGRALCKWCDNRGDEHREHLHLYLLTKIPKEQQQWEKQKARRNHHSLQHLQHNQSHDDVDDVDVDVDDDVDDDDDESVNISRELV